MALRTAAVKEKFESLGADPQNLSVAQFGSFIRADLDKWKKVGQAAGVKVE